MNSQPFASPITNRPLEHLWAARGLWLGAIAGVLAYVGTSMLKNEASRLRGVQLLAVAAVLAVIAWGGQRQLPVFAPRPAGRSGPRLALRNLLPLSAVILSATTGWQAGVQFLKHTDRIFGTAGGLWVSSIALLIAGTALWPTSTAGSVSVPATPAGVGEDGAPESGAGRLRDNIVELLVFFGLIAISFTVRLWKLKEIPFAIDPDEILTGRVAIGTYFPGSPVPIFMTVWSDVNLPALWFLSVAASLKYAGITLSALRLPAALFGAATVIPFYALVRATWGRTSAIAGSAALAVSACNLQYSRITVNNIVTSFFWAVCFHFLLRGLRRRRPLDWALAGLAGGLSEYFFYGTRLLPFVLAGFIVYLLAVHWRQAQSYLLHFLFLALGYLAGFGPLLAHHLSHRGLYLGRGLSVITWNHVPRNWVDLQQMLTTLWPLTRENLLGFSTLGEPGPFYWAPLLLPAEAALLVLGAALLLWRWRHPPSFLMLLAGFGVLLVVGTLLPGTRRFRDWTPAFPVFFTALALPVGAWAASASANLPRPLRYAAGGALVFGLAVLAWLNLDFFFNRYHVTRPEFEIRALQSRWQAALGSGYRVRTVGRTWQNYDPETNRYLIKDQDGANLFNPATELPLPGVAGKGIGFVFLIGGRDEYLPVVQNLYPGGTVGDIKSSQGIPLFATYVVSPAQAEAPYGIRLELLGGVGNVLWSGRVKQVGQLPPGIGDARRARWSGALYLLDAGRYRLEFSGPPAIVRLDELPRLPSDDSLLQAGWHRFVAEAALPGRRAVQLRLSKGESPPMEVPAVRLWPWVPGSGLLGATAAAGGRPVLRADPFIGFTALANAFIGPGRGINVPLRARWSGELHAAQPGFYTLELQTDGETRALLDGEAVLARCSTGKTERATASLFLQAGWHSFQLDHRASPGTSTLELLWTTPNGIRAFIPPEALRYATEETVDRLTPPVPPAAVDCSPPRRARDVPRRGAASRDRERRFGLTSPDSRIPVPASFRCP